MRLKGRIGLGFIGRTRSESLITQEDCLGLIGRTRSESFTTEEDWPGSYRRARLIESGRPLWWPRDRLLRSRDRHLVSAVCRICTAEAR